ncbi:MAG: hypothetical protein ABI243_12895 [Lapillicoccus sp.]
MSIEWLPRRERDGNGWRKPQESLVAGLPHLDQVAGRPGVVVPVVRIDRVARRSPVLALQAGVGAVAGVAGVAWSSWGMAVAGVGLAVSGSYRAGRQVILKRRHPSLALTPTTLHAGGLVLPWSVVEAVVHFSVKGPGVDGPDRFWNHIAVRVADFDNVVGLSPFRAGLANLSRRRLVLIAESAELRDPVTVSDALEHLVAHPGARLLLSGHEGVRLLTDGPPTGS